MNKIEKLKRLHIRFHILGPAPEAEYAEAEAFEDELFWLTTKTGNKKKCFFFFFTNCSLCRKYFFSRNHYFSDFFTAADCGNGYCNNNLLSIFFYLG